MYSAIVNSLQNIEDNQLRPPINNRLLIFIVAYQAEKTIQNVLSRIPIVLTNDYEVEVLIVDDASQDKTYAAGLFARDILNLPFVVTVLKNPVNQGYGGNQKIGYHYAIRFGFNFVALVHGDGQYAPECLPELLLSFKEEGVDAVFGSRMLTRFNALRGGMPIYKYIGNKILTLIENRLLGSSLSEFHSGYRIYSVNALKQIPFEKNTNDFHFDTEIIIQFIAKGFQIKELPIPTYYGDEICRVNGMRYAFMVILAVLKYRSQQLGIFYDRRFDLGNQENSLEQYELKLDGASPHSITIKYVDNDSTVLDLGCASGYVGTHLMNFKNCNVTGVDQYVHSYQKNLDIFIKHDLSLGPPILNYEKFKIILLLDVIEHVPNPEEFMEILHDYLGKNTDVKLLISTGNIGFFITRFMLLLGQFNYGKRGILDMTHTRLFTFASLRRLLEQSGFEIQNEVGVPAPFELALNGGIMAKLLTIINKLLIFFARNLFSYQIYVVVIPRPSVSSLLELAISYGSQKTTVNRVII